MELKLYSNNKLIATFHETFIEAQPYIFVGLRIKFPTIDTEINCSKEVAEKISHLLNTMANPEKTSITIDLDTGSCKLIPEGTSDAIRKTSKALKNIPHFGPKDIKNKTNTTEQTQEKTET